ncbi:MAG TPA: four helix bundle protein [Holophagaceae bacterium]|nr:four helix bundle protein [Holophagaceae bacterium]
MKDFRKLKVGEKAHQLALGIYKATETYPKSEGYGLTSQMRRAAVSIPMNLAEACGRGSDADMKRFVQIAMGSASELEDSLLISHDLELLPSSQFKSLELASNECSPHSS